MTNLECHAMQVVFPVFDYSQPPFATISFETNTNSWLFSVIIHQIFSLARDWSKRVTWVNIPQLKLGNIRGYSPIFKTARVA